MALVLRAKSKDGKINGEDVTELRRIMEMTRERFHTEFTSDPHVEVTMSEVVPYHDMLEIFNLPDYLRRSMLWVLKLDKASADEVANKTKRARAVESEYLNILVQKGYLEKDRKGRKVYFESSKKDKLVPYMKDLLSLEVNSDA